MIGNNTSVSMWVPILISFAILTVLLPFLKVRVDALLTVCIVFACITAGYCEFTRVGLDQLEYFAYLWFWIASYLIQLAALMIGKLAVFIKSAGSSQQRFKPDGRTVRKCAGLMGVFVVYEIIGGSIPILSMLLLIVAAVFLVPDWRTCLKLLPYQFGIGICLHSICYTFSGSVFSLAGLIGISSMIGSLLLFEAEIVLVVILALGIRRLARRQS